MVLTEILIAVAVGLGSWFVVESGLKDQVCETICEQTDDVKKGEK